MLSKSIKALITKVTHPNKIELAGAGAIIIAIGHRYGIDWGAVAAGVAAILKAAGMDIEAQAAAPERKS